MTRSTWKSRRRSIATRRSPQRGVGPGPWTEQSIDLRADLVRDGKPIDSNVFHRAAGGSGFGRIRGACEVMARLSTMLGRDIAGWLPAAMAWPAAAPEAPAAERLEKLTRQRVDGLITQEEFEQKRGEILEGL